MLAKRVTLALLAVRALSALASPVEHFTVQDSGRQVVSDSMCSDTEFATAPTQGPEVRLDDGLFVGIRKGETDNFLGIAFARPP
jgi:hypothetical protein